MIKQEDKRGIFGLFDSSVFFLFVLLVLTVFIYKNLFFAEFLDYDDIGNVVQNQSIFSLEIRNIITIFKTSVLYSYNPVTFLVYALEYRVFGMNPSGFHLINILLHLANILLVFRFTNLITGVRNTGLISASLFALHPIHTDIVGWISAQNYLLCTLFALLSIVYYIQYLKMTNRKKSNIVLSVLFFCLALLSKSQAVTLALIFLLINWLFKVRYNFHTLIITGIFFILAIVTGFATLYFRADMGKTEIIPDYSFAEKLLVISFSMVKYIWKLFIPVNLTAIDPFPVKSQGNWLPWIVYLSPVLIVSVIFILVKFKNKSPILITGVLFFVFNILITQVTFLEDSFSANRYFYLSSIGLYIPISMFGIYLYKKIARFRYWLLAGFGLLLILLMRITSLRSGEWENTYTLSSSIINKSPKVIMAYNLRGIWHYNQGKFDQSIQDFSKAIFAFPNYSSAYYNRGLSESALQNHDKALIDYGRAIELNPNFVSAYLARGIVMLDIQKNYPNAIEDFNKALSLKPAYPQAYYNLGLTYFRMQNLEEACRNWYFVKKLGYSQADGMIEKYCR